MGGRRESYFLIGCVVYSVLCCFLDFILFYLTWYSISTRTVRSVGGGGGRESDSMIFVLVCGICPLIYLLCCVVILFYFSLLYLDNIFENCA